MLPEKFHGIASMKIVDRDMARVLAEKTETERLQIAWGMWRSARRMITRVVAAEYPSLSQQEIQREVAKRLSHGTCICATLEASCVCKDVTSIASTSLNGPVNSLSAKYGAWFSSEKMTRIDHRSNGRASIWHCSQRGKPALQGGSQEAESPRLSTKILRSQARSG
jgi:hypothetical protein